RKARSLDELSFDEEARIHDVRHPAIVELVVDGFPLWQRLALTARERRAVGNALFRGGEKCIDALGIWRDPRREKLGRPARLAVLENAPERKRIARHERHAERVVVDGRVRV